MCTSRNYYNYAALMQFYIASYLLTFTSISYKPFSPCRRMYILINEK